MAPWREQILNSIQGLPRNRPPFFGVFFTYRSPVSQTFSDFFPSPRPNVGPPQSGIRGHSFGAVYFVVPEHQVFLISFQHWDGARVERRPRSQRETQLVLVNLGRSIWWQPLGCASPSKISKIVVYSRRPTGRLGEKKSPVLFQLQPQGGWNLREKGGRKSVHLFWTQSGSVWAGPGGPPQNGNPHL